MLDPRIASKLAKAGVPYRIIRQDKPILSVVDAAPYFPVAKAAPVFVLQTERGLVGCLTSAQNGRLDLTGLKQLFGFRKLKMAERQEVKRLTGFAVGTIPLVGLEIPCLFDQKLLAHDLVYGGTGDEFLTIELAPTDLLKLNEIIGMFE